MNVAHLPAVVAALERCIAWIEGTGSPADPDDRLNLASARVALALACDGVPATKDVVLTLWDALSAILDADEEEADVGAALRTQAESAIAGARRLYPSWK